MNPEIEFEMTVTVEWNSLEATILKHLFDYDEYPIQKNYTHEEMVELNSDLAKAMDPNNKNVIIPARFYDRDNTGTHRNAVKKLFADTETIIANLERAEILTDNFQYDPSQTL